MLPSQSALQSRLLSILSFLMILLLLPAIGCTTGGLASDEKVVFFPSIAHRDADGHWLIPVNGWVYEPRLSDRTFEYLISSHFLDLDQFVRNPADRELLIQRVHPFIVDNKVGRNVAVVVAGRELQLTKSSKHGLFADNLALPADGIPPGSPEVSTSNGGKVVGAGWVTYRTVASPNGTPFEGRVQLVEPSGLSVISDIDDTIRVTEVLNTKRMIEHTFLERYEPVPGMPEVYADWAQNHGAVFHYVSASAYQLYQPLSDFVAQNYPEGSMDMKIVPFEGNALKYFVEMMDSPLEVEGGADNATIRRLQIHAAQGAQRRRAQLIAARHNSLSPGRASPLF